MRILYHVTLSPFSRKVRLVLAEKGLDFTLKFEKTWERRPEFLALNPAGEVPVLEHGGRTLCQSGVILDYLAQTFGKFGWADDDERREILRWLLWDNHKLTSYTATRRWLRTFTDGGETAVAEMLRTRSDAALAVLNSHLGGHDFALGDKPTIADISMCGYLFWPEDIGVSWADYPHIGAWLERIKALPGWVHPYELMPLAPVA
jgi:glutathione S-transferase